MFSHMEKRLFVILHALTKKRQKLSLILPSPKPDPKMGAVIYSNFNAVDRPVPIGVEIETVHNPHPIIFN